MMQAVVQCVSAAFVSYGFGLIYHVNRRSLLFVTAGGTLGWLAYLIGYSLWGGVFLPNLLAGFCTASIAEIMARVLNAPATTFFMPSTIPLVPGSTLYYCMNAVAGSRYAEAAQYGWKTAMCALGIASGMAIAWCVADFSRKVQEMRADRL